MIGAACTAGPPELALPPVPVVMAENGTAPHPDFDASNPLGMGFARLMTHFDSLGDNCEFGLVQRWCGAEPLGLLRWSMTRLPDLVRGVATAYAGAGRAERLETHVIKQEYYVVDPGFGLSYHPFRSADEITPEALIAQESIKLRFLSRVFRERLESGEKIFVRKDNEPTLARDIMGLFLALNEHAPNTLLWVVPADTGHPAGSVDVLMSGLLRGHVERFAPHWDAYDAVVAPWLSVCMNAYRLWRDHPFGRGPGPRGWTGARFCPPCLRHV